jgi:hypothetical protein
MTEREHNLNVRVSREEMAKLHRIAADRDLTVSTLLRHVLRDLYATRFGSEPAPDVDLRDTRPAPKRRRRK